MLILLMFVISVLILLVIVIQVSLWLNVGSNSPHLNSPECVLLVFLWLFFLCLCLWVLCGCVVGVCVCVSNNTITKLLWELFVRIWLVPAPLNWQSCQMPNIWLYEAIAVFSFMISGNNLRYCPKWHPSMVHSILSHSENLHIYSLQCNFHF